MSLRIRGQETKLILVVNGVQLTGSFSVVDNVKVTPLDEIQESNFLGETESEFDYIHNGYEVNFTIDEMDNKAFTSVMLPFVEANRQGAPYPNVNAMFVKSYRDGTAPATTVCKALVVKLDDQTNAGRKEYVKSTFTGRCREVSQY